MQTGTYVIKNITYSKNYLGLKPTGPDQSEVVLLPSDVEPVRWDVQKLDGKKFKITVRGQIVGKRNKVVVAGSNQQTWIITSQYHHGQDVYTIEAADQSNTGWVLREPEPYQQINCDTLIVGPSEPPYYPPFQVWVFDRA